MRFVSLCALVVAVNVCCSEDGGKSMKALKKQLNEIKDIVDLKLNQLKVLRNELRSLNQELKLNDEKIRYGNGTANNLNNGGFKKRVRNKLRGIQKKLGRLERSFRKHRKVVKDVKPTTEIASVLPTPDIIEAFEAQRNRSRPGEHDSPCNSHNECKPGHCCHKKDNGNKCVKHGFKIGEGCQDSCSCETHLICFKPNKGNTKAYCKEARADDFMRGNYRNNKTSTFSD
ncbi:unnamed protein product [Bursaphelenchus okinawaensis]|uniref:Uncharacterized protein n=1 Tax=Bursaphelenchus okinawaensis TaxID=465554 RepID=A0A811K737_9BILA|nr:unnamed protein product [Bursaphelenchus okinawaensis]CAG9092790.1 unnamed protein product [Bursaphelenchus okinawaensis]